MDEHSFDAGALRKWAGMQVLPAGRMIPDCSYRTIHRASDPRFQAPGGGQGRGNDGLRHKLVRLGRAATLAPGEDYRLPALLPALRAFQKPPSSSLLLVGASLASPPVPRPPALEPALSPSQN